LGGEPTTDAIRFQVEMKKDLWGGRRLLKLHFGKLDPDGGEEGEKMGVWFGMNGGRGFMGTKRRLINRVAEGWRKA